MVKYVLCELALVLVAAYAATQLLLQALSPLLRILGGAP